jgi:hypothetical protein
LHVNTAARYSHGLTVSKYTHESTPVRSRIHVNTAARDSQLRVISKHTHESTPVRSRMHVNTAARNSQRRVHLKRHTHESTPVRSRIHVNTAARNSQWRVISKHTHESTPVMYDDKRESGSDFCQALLSSWQDVVSSILIATLSGCMFTRTFNCPIFFLIDLSIFRLCRLINRLISLSLTISSPNRVIGFGDLTTINRLNALMSTYHANMSREKLVNSHGCI